MPENKTQPTDQKPEEFIANVDHNTRREDAYKLLEIFREITGEPGTMWGDSIIGFGRYHYKYDSGQEGDWPMTGFSPRKAKMSVYIMTGVKRYPELLEELGPYKNGASCLYLGPLSKIDLNVLKKMIKLDYQEMQKRYPV